MTFYTQTRNLNYRVIFDGQSLNYVPSVANSYPRKLMANRGISFAVVAQSGAAWVQLKDRVTTRLVPHTLRASMAIVIGLGGTTDYALGTSGTNTYNSEVTWANNIRNGWTGAGRNPSDLFIIQTTTTPAYSFGANTAVAAGSNGVNTNTFSGSGTLNVASTTNAGNTGTLKVATAGTMATITYTGKTGTTFTGCNTTSGGGVMSTGGTVRNSGYQNLFDGNALVLADASAAFNYKVDLAGDSRLSDPSNTTYYDVDGVHLTNSGAQVVADLIAPTLNTILSS